MGCACYHIHRLPRKGPDHQQRVSHSVLTMKSRKKRPHLKKKSLCFIALCHKSIKMKVKLHESGYELLPHAPFSPDLAPSNLFLFADLKRMLAGKKFSTKSHVAIVGLLRVELPYTKKNVILFKFSTS
jgi:hypothetical protein